MDHWNEELSRWDWHVEEEVRRAETFRRIHFLVRHGYQIDWSVTDVDDALWMNHPAGGPALIVFADGKVVSRGFEGAQKTVINPIAKEENDRFYNEDARDAEAFNRWVRSLPFPTAWQSGSPWRERKLYPLIIFAAAVAMLLLVANVLSS